jgi:Family of unknown function (DUF6629)
MCFSAQADLVGGVVITVIGVDAVRHVRHRRELIALAPIPLLLGGCKAMYRAGSVSLRCGLTC